LAVQETEQFVDPEGQHLIAGERYYHHQGANDEGRHHGHGVVDELGAVALEIGNVGFHGQVSATLGIAREAPAHRVTHDDPEQDRDDPARKQLTNAVQYP